MLGIVPAAGSGERMGSKRSKLLLTLFESRSVLDFTLQSLADSRCLDRLVLTAPLREISDFELAVAPYAQRFADGISVIPGGGSRQESVFLALCQFGDRADYVLVHDGARPLVHSEDIQKVVGRAQMSGAAILASPEVSTLKKVSEGSTQVSQTIRRQNIWEAQTPQAFSTQILQDAHTKAQDEGYIGTDESELVERLGASVEIIPGPRTNIKITSPEDLLLAQGILGSRTKSASEAAFI